MKSYKDKVAAITGAGSGIGRALAIKLGEQGCSLALSDVNETGLKETKRLLAQDAPGVKVTTARVDVSRRDEMEAWAATVVKEHGQVNLIFNNAGVAHAGSVASTSYDDYEWIIAINFWGVIHGTKAFLPHLKAAGEGHVVNISSVFGLFAQPMFSAYNASKFAVRGFTESLRQELDLEQCGVSASCVHPGGVKTNITRNARIDNSVENVTGRNQGNLTTHAERLLKTTADQAALAILKGVRRNQRRILVGPDAKAVDVMQRSAPAMYQRVMTFALKRMG